MATRLDRLLESIHPARTLAEVGRRADEAITTFQAESAHVGDWDGFRACIIRFLHHAETRLLRLHRSCPMGMDFDWSRCYPVLVRVYGPNGEKAAFEMARTGNEGGLYGVLKRFAQGLAEQYGDTEIAARVDAYWNDLSVDEQLAAADEYLSKYGHLLPSELTEGSAARVRTNMPKVLREHPRLLHRLGRIGRA